MNHLKELLDMDDGPVKSRLLKKAFMPYTQRVEIDGVESEALTILLNLSQSKPVLDSWLNQKRAQQYFQTSKNLEIACDEIQWLHTHNLKYPDSRVSGQRLIAEPLPSDTATLTSAGLPKSYGWAHNSAVYHHTIWLINEFIWRGQIENILSLVTKKDDFWSLLLTDFGLDKSLQSTLLYCIEEHLPATTFPSEVSRYSKQIRIPWKDDYLSITPVVSHAMQLKIEDLAREPHRHFRFKTDSLPNPASIGSLCGALGGHISILNYPLGVQVNSKNTLVSRRVQSRQFFDDYALTNKRMCTVFAHLIGVDAPQTRKGWLHVRKYQMRMVRRQIARWLLPLIEIREKVYPSTKVAMTDLDDQLVKCFINADESDFLQLLKPLNQRLHFALQNNRFSMQFAYHPKLLQPLKTQLKWVLNELSKPVVGDQQQGQEQYIYLSSMRVFDANAQSCPYLCGVPSLTAIWGFMHQFQRGLISKLAVSPHKIKFAEFAVFIRSETIKSGAKLTEPSVPALKRHVSPVKRPTILTNQYTDLVFDVVIKVHSDIRISDYRPELKSAIPVNFAGGTLFQPEISNCVHWLTTFSDAWSLFQAIKGLPSYGEWLSPYTDQPQTLEELGDVLAEDPSLIPVSNGF
ncbi:type I-F CRISPR-associated protein Csy2 [Celerinatantimonas sp. MCCC 1A17872]|uniref:type I-F CRISPR-associated protein Csy2 n=1 Tax=Celerinatantimonas sp. MCCC 1A17872 TaxID=3177514 RepID=UPI0038CA45FC